MFIIFCYFFSAHVSFGFLQKLIAFGSNMRDVDKENTTLPDYLPEEVDSPKAHTKPLARNKGDNKREGGWLSSAATFITNSFYW